MPLQELIKSKICIELHLANFPLKPFVEWASIYNDGKILACLSVLQHELNAEKKKYELENSELKIQFVYWSFYCEQVRIYYRTLIRNPAAVKELEFLLCG